MLRIAIAGCGRHSEEHHAAPLAQYAREHPGELELVAACDLRAERAQRFCAVYGFRRAYTDLEEMVNEAKPDGVVCVLPYDIAPEVAMWCLRRGLPCTIEKPLGATREAAHELARVARQTGTPHMVSVNRRYAPQLRRGLEWARAAGAVRCVRAAMLRSKRSEPEFIWATGIHIVDAVRHIAGNVVRWECEVIRYPELAADWYSVTLWADGGALARIDVLPGTGVAEEVYEMHGEEFRVRVSLPCGSTSAGAALACWRGNRLELNEVPGADVPLWRTSGAYSEVEAFVRMLKSGEPTLSPVEEILPSMDLCWDIAEAARRR